MTQPNNPIFFVNGMSEAETRVIASLCCMTHTDDAFCNLIWDMNRMKAFTKCKTLGDHARAVLRFQLAYLVRLKSKSKKNASKLETDDDKLLAALNEEG